MNLRAYQPYALAGRTDIVLVVTPQLYKSLDCVWEDPKSIGVDNLSYSLANGPAFTILVFLLWGLFNKFLFETDLLHIFNLDVLLRPVSSQSRLLLLSSEYFDYLQWSTRHSKGLNKTYV